MRYKMENNIAKPGTIKELMAKYNVRPNKSLGQNFLVDNNILDKIIEAGEVSESDHVVEIGPGLGSLTERLACSADKVTVIEKDSSLIPVLKETLSEYNNIRYIEGDVLKVDWDEITEPGERVKVIANLPYYITTPIIMGILEQDLPVDLMVFMVQKEVAERMVAGPTDGKDYGSLSIAVQFYSDVEIVSTVPPTVFIPRPTVDSAIVKLSRLTESAVKVQSKEMFFKVVRASFQQRRKTLRNSLSNVLDVPLSKDEITEAIESVGLDSRVRGEKLGLDEFGRLANEICNLLE